ncbi:MAG: YegS/Rv2252/BmrU family lipid kinase [Calothrix sp. C42_A2020_038]|nr:YegS/Rv2252/BmrU family lipid kinase [Calothrix sp. C42_A2020_038]
MTMKASLIFNPSSGQNDAVEDLEIIRKHLEPKINLDICPLHKGLSANETMQQAINEGAEMILIAGGDGTISSVIEPLIGKDIPVGIIPRGTVNAFAKALNIPIDIEAACETILSGRPHRVDTATCNGKPMIVLAGIGLEPETIVQSSRRLKKRFGMISFLLAGIKELGEFNTFEAVIETENQMMNLRAIAVTVANTAASTSLLAHGPASIIPDDGLLDVTIFAPKNRTNAFFGAYHLLRSGFTDDATNRNDIQYLRAKNVKVKTKPLQKVSLDGDSIESTNVEIYCIPRSLTVLVPT